MCSRAPGDRIPAGAAEGRQRGSSKSATQLKKKKKSTNGVPFSERTICCLLKFPPGGASVQLAPRFLSVVPELTCVLLRGGGGGGLPLQGRRRKPLAFRHQATVRLSTSTLRRCQGLMAWNPRRLSRLRKVLWRFCGIACAALEFNSRDAAEQEVSNNALQEASVNVRRWKCHQRWCHILGS